MNPFIKQFRKPDGLTGRLLGKIMTVSNRKMHKAVLSELSFSGILLEIGFGSGSQIKMIHKRYPAMKLYGIDISDEMLRMAEKTVGENAQLSVGDCSETKFENDLFDTVISTDYCPPS